MSKTIYAKLAKVQSELKAPKGQYNSFGKYRYRSCEDILEVAKPLCHKHGLVLMLSDKVCMIGDRYYIEATASVASFGDDIAEPEIVEVTAYARESAIKKGMDDSQVTGTASSYARKYALNGLFAIDDTKDADTNEYHNSQQTGDSAVFVCADCGKMFKPYTSGNGKTYTAGEVYEASRLRNADGVARCAACRKKHEAAE